MPEIRKYEIKDLELVEEVFKLNVPDFFAVHELQELKSYLEHHYDTYFVMEECGMVVGAGGYHISKPGTGRLSWDFFHPDFRGRGFGTTLIRHCLKELEKDNIEKIEVWTSQKASKFYEKFGFEIERIEKDHWSKGLDLYLMTKAKD